MTDDELLLVPKSQIEKVEQARKAIWEILANLPELDGTRLAIAQHTPTLYEVAHRRYETALLKQPKRVEVGNDRRAWYLRIVQQLRTNAEVQTKGMPSALHDFVIAGLVETDAADAIEELLYAATPQEQPKEEAEGDAPRLDDLVIALRRKAEAERGFEKLAITQESGPLYDLEKYQQKEHFLCAKDCEDAAVAIERALKDGVKILGKDGKWYLPTQPTPPPQEEARLTQAQGEDVQELLRYCDELIKRRNDRRTCEPDNDEAEYRVATALRDLLTRQVPDGSAILRSIMENRCYACGWRFAPNADSGCTPFNCSFRPGEHDSQHGPWLKRMQEMSELARRIAAAPRAGTQAREIPGPKNPPRPLHDKEFG